MRVLGTTAQAHRGEYSEKIGNKIVVPYGMCYKTSCRPPQNRGNWFEGTNDKVTHYIVRCIL